MVEFNKNRGLEAEHAFIRELNDRGIPYDYVDDWCDFFVYGAPVDVKSTGLNHKFYPGRGKKMTYKLGRFDLTDDQIRKKIWLALFLRFGERYFFLGILKYNHNNKKRYIPLSKLREHTLYSIEEFVKKIKNNG